VLPTRLSRKSKSRTLVTLETLGRMYYSYMLSQLHSCLKIFLIPDMDTNENRTNWASLAPENVACAISTKQSPIDVTNTSTTLVAPGALAMNFPAVAAAEFENIGTTIEVVMEGKGASTAVDGTT
jgi:carbonic anhydrase